LVPPTPKCTSIGRDEFFTENPHSSTAAQAFVSPSGIIDLPFSGVHGTTMQKISTSQTKDLYLCTKRQLPSFINHDFDVYRTQKLQKI
jgi:hypothetical protein